MPLARYFLFVGGVLLALLFISDWVLPSLPTTDRAADTGTNKPLLRINSEQKWPERVAFDTSVPPIAPVQTATTEEAVTPPAAGAAADISAKARDAFAQLRPPVPKKPEPHRKRKIAKKHHGPPTVLVAQQPRFGFFVSNIW